MLGLLLRRRKWHLAEYNRIVATWDQLPSELAQVAVAQHRSAIAELDAFGAGLEPDWGSEEEETRKYLEHPPAETVQEPERQESL